MQKSLVSSEGFVDGVDAILIELALLIATRLFGFAPPQIRIDDVLIVSDGRAPLIFALLSMVRSIPCGFERLRAHRRVPDVLIVMPFCAWA